MVPGLAFTKGHGTENDFVVLPDPDGELPLSGSLVRALCDRRSGLGADGVLRVVRTAAEPSAAHLADRAEWFMDYRNADGGIAEMCGNGIRVYARYLVQTGRVPAGPLTLATRAGVRRVVVDPDGEVTVEMGPAVLAADPVEVVLAGRTALARQVTVGNPHAVVFVDTPLDRLDLERPPLLPPQRFPTGGNVEFVQRLGPGRLAMRVHERGVGETRSCGSGACAAAVAAAAEPAGGAAAGSRWLVSCPGGELAVGCAESSVTLRGPAVLVASGELDPGWLAAGAGRPLTGSNRAAPVASRAK